MTTPLYELSREQLFDLFTSPDVDDVTAYEARCEFDAKTDAVEGR